MSKKTVRFYTPADEKKILRAYKSATGKDQKVALTAIAKALGRTYGSVYFKAITLAKKDGTYVPQITPTSSFTPAQEDQLKVIKSMPKGKERTDAIHSFAQSVNRTSKDIYQKMARMYKTKISKVRKQYTKNSSPAKVAKVSGSTIRFPYRSIEIDAGTQEIVVRL